MIKKYEIIWSPQAEASYLKIIEYLLKVWTLKEVLASEKQKNIRRCVITSQTSLAYRIVHNSIELITFFDNRSKHKY